MFFDDAKDMKEIEGTVFSAPPTAFDPVTGYRWLGGGIRMVRVIRGEVVIDNVFDANSHGYHCTHEYRPARGSDRTFRFIALGDSFTNCINQTRAWPETLQELLRGRPDHGLDVEVYGMPSDGGGLLNWHAIFTGQILPQFDFDALIIADWGDDLGREFIVSHSTQEAVLLDRWPAADRPRTQEDFERLLPEMQKLYDVADGERVERFVANLTANAAPAPVSPEDYCPKGPSEAWKDMAAAAPADYAFSPEVFIERFGRGRWDMLSEIAAVCGQRGAPIIYSPLPSRQGLLRIRKEGVKLLHQAQAEGISRHFALEYFDGYQAFEGISPEAIVDFHWLKHDGHWAAGANLYALKLAEWLMARRFWEWRR